MNKGDLIENVANESGLSKADAGRAVDAMIGAVTGALKKGGQVSLVGFGTFSVKARAARMGRNPRTGEAIQIKASNVPGFKAGKALMDALNSRALSSRRLFGRRLDQSKGSALPLVVTGGGVVLGDYLRFCLGRFRLGQYGLG
jgi:DNA-binding protein HU-beta